MNVHIIVNTSYALHEHENETGISRVAVMDAHVIQNDSDDFPLLRKEHQENVGWAGAKNSSCVSVTRKKRRK